MYRTRAVCTSEGGARGSTHSTRAVQLTVQHDIHVHACTLYVTFTAYKYNVHVIVVSWFLQCMGYVLREGCMYFRGQSLRKYIVRGRYISHAL